MRFEQIRKLLDHTQEFHRRLAEHYERLRDETERERTRMLLEYVSHLERTLERSLEDYETDASRVVLDTWIDFATDERFMGRLETLSTATDITLDEIVPEVLDLHAAVVASYEAIDLGAMPPEVAAVIEDVIAFEKEQSKRLTRAAGQLQDL